MRRYFCIILAGDISSATFLVFSRYRKKYPCFGLVHHYRYCRKGKMPACMTEYERLADTSMATWSLRFYKNVLAVREAVFGSIDVP